MATKENLEEAFAGESQANRKYLAFAKRAESEGFVNIARLFRATAAAETVHANSHFRVLKGVKSTEENLAGAMAGEEFEFKNMYPKFIEEATAENEGAANISFKNAMAVEQVHYSLYSQAMERIKAGEDIGSSKVYVCEICGHTVLDEAPDKCPVCNAPKAKFTKIE
jgi:rubrerythrin